MRIRYFLLFLVLFTSLNNGAFIQAIHWLSTFVFLCDALPEGDRKPRKTFKERWKEIDDLYKEVATTSINIYLVSQQMNEFNKKNLIEKN